MRDAPPEWGEIPTESICLTIQRNVLKTRVILSGRSFRLKMGHERSKWKDKTSCIYLKVGGAWKRSHVAARRYVPRQGK